VLALTTTGRRSGLRRTTTVAYLQHRDGVAVTALNLGSDRHPAWSLNLRADADASVHVNGEEKPVRAREARGEEADALWRAIIDRLPTTGQARQLARREVPIFVLDPVPLRGPG
jgi:deazaflavin-dependent oxidoreductase (nitroreductase family)